MQATLHHSNTLTTSKHLDIASVMSPLSVGTQRPPRLILAAKRHTLAEIPRKCHNPHHRLNPDSIRAYMNGFYRYGTANAERVRVPLARPSPKQDAQAKPKCRRLCVRLLVNRYPPRLGFSSLPPSSIPLYTRILLAAPRHTATYPLVRWADQDATDSTVQTPMCAREQRSWAHPSGLSLEA